MSRSEDPGHFFQTTEALATTERKAAKAKNKFGNPTKLPSKILAGHTDRTSNNEEDILYIAEAAGEVKRVKLESSKIERVFRQDAAPLTCLAICHQSRLLFTGSWDKNIYAVPLDRDGPARSLKGHTDFVKRVLATTLNGKPILVSGGADASIIVWDISSDNFGAQLHKLKGHTKALQDLTIDPESIPADASSPADSFTLFTASSDREIRRWHISRETAHELSDSQEKPICVHDTSVYKLTWDADGDLWTASADKTVRHLVRARDWAADTVLTHPDFVRDVYVDDRRGLVVTACRDEEVRVWSTANSQLVCTYSGHYEEVTGLVPIRDGWVASVSIDGTVRRWGLDKDAMTAYHEAVAKEASGEGNNAGAKTGMLTAEEEAELAELMDDEDDD